MVPPWLKMKNWMCMCVHASAWGGLHFCFAHMILPKITTPLSIECLDIWNGLSHNLLPLNFCLALFMEQHTTDKSTCFWKLKIYFSHLGHGLLWFLTCVWLVQNKILQCNKQHWNHCWCYKSHTTNCQWDKFL